MMATRYDDKKLPRAGRVREPVQVYLDAADRDLLEQMAAITELARAEVLRRGLRSLANSALSHSPEDESLGYLIGALGSDKSTTPDLAEAHDQYLARADEKDHRRSRVAGALSRSGFLAHRRCKL